MRSDDPTVPNLGWDTPGAAPEPGASGERPTWPIGDERPPHARELARPPSGYVNATLFGVSLGANGVLLLGLLSLLLLSHAGTFAPGGSSGSSAPGAALSSPTATSSPTPSSGWLQVAPSSVQLGCDAGQRTQFVVLENTGPQRVQWQADVVGSGDQTPAGVAMSPDHGELDAGASLPLQIQNMTDASGAQGVSSQQGVIRFTAASADAGPSASLSYTTVGCP